jgi:tRNA threonylcarbamoyladenosine biosynthesis protein TsaB
VILIIESSADFPSVAICDLQGIVQFEKQADVFQSHSEQLPVLVKNALDFIDEQSLDLLAIGVNQGPGSYTGLRIGVSLAKGLCYAKNLPLLAIDAFEAMGQYLFSYNRELKIVYAMIDARRDEVFLKRLELGKIAKVEAKILDNLIEEDKLDTLLKAKRSNNILTNTKLCASYKIRPLKECIIEALNNMKKN